MSILREKTRVIDQLVLAQNNLSKKPDHQQESWYELNLRELRELDPAEYVPFAHWYGKYLKDTYKPTPAKG